jgi:hypothetical protein
MTTGKERNCDKIKQNRKKGNSKKPRKKQELLENGL